MVKNPLGIKALREVKSNLKQYISVILIAALAVTLFTGILANWRSLEYKVNKIYNDSNMCDAIITTELVENSKLETNIEKYLKNNHIFYEKRLLLLGKSDNINLSIAAFDSLNKLNKPILTTNNTLTNDDVLVDKGLLDRKNIKLGENINVDIEGLGIKASIKLKVTQTMTHPEALDNANYSQSLVYVGKNALVNAVDEYIKSYYPSFIANKFDKEFIRNYLDNSYNQILIKDSNSQQIIEDIKEYSEVIYALNRNELPSNITIEADIIQAKKLLYIFPVIFYAVALLIILTSITQLINKEAKNIGLLQGLGYSKKEIIIHYVSIFTIVSLIGAIIGIILGPIIIPFVLDQKYNILYQLPKIKTPFFRFEYLYSVLILFIITIFNTLVALHKTLNKLPALSIRGENNYTVKDTLLDKMPVFDSKLLNLKMAIRNMKRSISRTLMVILGVMGCSALLLCGFGIEDTLNNSIDSAVELVTFDINAQYKTPGFYKSDLESIDGVSYAAEFAYYNIQLNKDKVINTSLYIMPNNVDMLHFDIDDNSCLISTKVSETINANVGDEIKYTYNNKVYKVKITGILETSINQGIYLTINSKFDKPEFKPTNVYIKTLDNYNNIKVVEEIRKLDNIVRATSIEEQLDMIDNTIGTIRIMTNTIKVFAIMLAIVVLYNLALLNFNDRMRDIATLKVLGYNKREIISSFMIEILILTILGSFIGLGLGTPLMKGVLGVNENPLLTYLYNIKPLSFVITILLTAFSSIIMNMYMSKNIKKVKMVESLKSVE